ncbi:MAG: hypothetical protein GY853_02645 [PVC group bacterium]|nr:hypothetical protein [PVC group bacterium]
MKKCKKTTERVQQIKPKKIKKDIFKKYGQIIEWDGPQKKKSINQFRIVTREEKSEGWRIAYLIVREKTIDRLEQHVNSLESFEPVKGKSILYVSNQEKPERIESFILDRPVVLKKGIWHGVVSLDKEAHIKITENNKVRMKRYKLGYNL